MTASRRHLYGKTSRTHCSGVILSHSSTQTVFKSWRFCGPLLWTLIFNSFHRFSIGFKSCNWLGHSSSFTFFLWTNSFLGCVFGIIVSLKYPPSFHLHHPGRWQQIFLSRMSRYIFHSSFLQLYEFCKCYTMMFWGDVQCLQTWCVLWHPKTIMFVSSDQIIFSQYFTGLSKCCAANLGNKALHGELAYRPRRLSALLIVFFETILHANSRFSEALYKWSLALGQLFL